MNGIYAIPKVCKVWEHHRKTWNSNSTIQLSTQRWRSMSGVVNMQKNKIHKNTMLLGSYDANFKFDKQSVEMTISVLQSWIHIFLSSSLFGQRDSDQLLGFTNFVQLWTNSETATPIPIMVVKMLVFHLLALLLCYG